ncbi:MAG: antirestriction protein [Hydrogenophilales bacterium]|nr:antirestriction protein [Hydrogenophilales bacterium]
MNVSTIIYRKELIGSERTEFTAKLLDVNFPLLLEPVIFAFAGKLSPEYSGGYWRMYTPSNGAFFMAPDTERYFKVVSPNGYEAVLSADALGITACLFAYSQLSFTASPAFAEVCAEQFHLLREYMLDQPEAEGILGVID